MKKCNSRAWRDRRTNECDGPACNRTNTCDGCGTLDPLWRPDYISRRCRAPCWEIYEAVENLIRPVSLHGCIVLSRENTNDVLHMSFLPWWRDDASQRQTKQILAIDSIVTWVEAVRLPYTSAFLWDKIRKELSVGRTPRCASVNHFQRAS